MYVFFVDFSCLMGAVARILTKAHLIILLFDCSLIQATSECLLGSCFLINASQCLLGSSLIQATSQSLLGSFLIQATSECLI